jgi:hypothetical protein
MSDATTDRSDADPDADPLREHDAPGSTAGRSDASGEAAPPDRPRQPAGSTLPRTHQATVETDAPPDARAVVCDRCGRPFARESYLALHRGLAHEDDLTPDEQSAYRTAVDEETAQLRRFRIVALGALVLLYFGFLFAYAAFT